MAKVIFLLMSPLVLLGGLIYKTVDMHGEMQQLKVENQQLSHELSQLRSNYEKIAQEHSTVLAENANIKSQFNAMQTAYLAENQARLKAESEIETYKNLLLNQGDNMLASSPSACVPAEGQGMKPEQALLSTIAPVGAGSITTLVTLRVLAAIVNYSRKQKKLRSLPPQIRNLR